MLQEHDNFNGTAGSWSVFLTQFQKPTSTRYEKPTPTSYPGLVIKNNDRGI